MGLDEDAVTPASAGSGTIVWALLAEEQALSPELESEWLLDLPPARREVLRAWPDRRARHRSLLGSRLLLEGLRRLDFPATLAGLRQPPNARPTLDLPLDFNLSHGDGLVACALCTSARVGIDVERVTDVDASGFARYLSPAERAWAGQDPRRFCTVWTRKESVAKAAGSLGLAALPRIDTANDPSRAAFDGRTWLTLALPAGAGFVAHLATDAADVALRCQWPTMATLTGRARASQASG